MVFLQRPQGRAGQEVGRARIPGLSTILHQPVMPMRENGGLDEIPRFLIFFKCFRRRVNGACVYGWWATMLMNDSKGEKQNKKGGFSLEGRRNAFTRVHGKANCFKR